MSTLKYDEYVQIYFLKHFPYCSYKESLSSIEKYPLKVIEMFVSQNLNISHEEAKKWCKENNPTLCFKQKDGSEMCYSYLSGFIGVQLNFNF